MKKPKKPPEGMKMKGKMKGKGGIAKGLGAMMGQKGKKPKDPKGKKNG